MQDYGSIEIQNRIKNLMWTISGNYQMEGKVDVETFLHSKYVALYDGIKQGAFHRYFDWDALGMYLVKKVYCHAQESPLVFLAQMCMEEAIYRRITAERKGVDSLRKKALNQVLDQNFEQLTAHQAGRLRIAMIREALDGPYMVPKQLRSCMEQLYTLRDATDTMEIIRVLDRLYNQLIEPAFEKRKSTLEEVLAVTLEELTEFGWEDYLSEEMYEEALSAYMERMMDQAAGCEAPETQEERQEKQQKKKLLVIDEESKQKIYDYTQLNFGESYLSETQAKSLNHQLCRGVHSGCQLYFTEGILKNPTKRSYQYEYARRQLERNMHTYYDHHRIVKSNIAQLTATLRKSLTLRAQTEQVLSDRGQILPARLWRVGRSSEANLFYRELKQHAMELVVDVLIDASGSQQKRQGLVAMQAYIISEALSNVGIPHRVMSFCTFWNHTVMHRMRDYDDHRRENSNIFQYKTSSNNRDGLAIKAAAQGLLKREEDNKILILLSDGKPYDVVLRQGADNEHPYEGEVAARDTAFEVRRLRAEDVAVLGVFAGEEKDLATEKRIFGKDFAYIRDISQFSRLVGQYLVRQLEEQ